MISVPSQNNTYFDLGPKHDQTANVLNFQPAIPIPASSLRYTFIYVFETERGPYIVDANADLLKRNRNILEKLKPGKGDGILLLPIRSAGSVSAIFYADTGGKEAPLPVDALKILTEFAGAQLDAISCCSASLCSGSLRSASPCASAPAPGSRCLT